MRLKLIHSTKINQLPSKMLMQNLFINFYWPKIASQRGDLNAAGHLYLDLAKLTKKHITSTESY